MLCSVNAKVRSKLTEIVGEIEISEKKSHNHAHDESESGLHRGDGKFYAPSTIEMLEVEGAEQDGYNGQCIEDEFAEIKSKEHVPEPKSK